MCAGADGGPGRHGRSASLRGKTVKGAAGGCKAEMAMSPEFAPAKIPGGGNPGGYAGEESDVLREHHSRNFVTPPPSFQPVYLNLTPAHGPALGLSH